MRFARSFLFEKKNQAVGKSSGNFGIFFSKSMKTENEFYSIESGISPVVGSILSSVMSVEKTGETSGISFSPENASLEESDSASSDTVQNILSKLENKRELAAENLGVTAGEVESLPFDLSALETEGIFMNIDTHGFGSLSRQLDWKTLGVKLPEASSVLLSPPRAGLLPDSYRRRLLRGAAQAHQALKKYGFRFSLCETVFGTTEYKWIPWSAFERFEADYNKSCETLAKAKREVLSDYDDILEILREDFRRLAEDSAKRLEASLEEPFDRDEFTAKVVANALSMIPTREFVRDSLTIEMKPKVIILGSEMIAEQVSSRKLGLERAKIDAEREQVWLELETKAQIENQKLSEFEADQKREREVKERIRQMKIEAAQKEAERAISPVKEGLEQITSKIFEAASEMAEKLQKADFVPGALAKRAVQMCEWYRLMNFTNDASLEDVLEKLEQAAGRDSSVRTPSEMRGALADVMRATTMQTKRLLDEDRMSNLEI